jgi:hypothetical protein
VLDSRTSPDDPEAATNGVQWRTIGSGLAVFWLSWVATYLLGSDAPGGTSRGWAALRAAGVIFLIAVLGMRVLAGFVSRDRLASNATFLVVWVVAFVGWFLWVR